MPFNRYIKLLFPIIVGLCVIQSLRTFESVLEDLRYLVYAKPFEVMWNG